MKKSYGNFLLYELSTFLRYFSLGIFFVLYELYISASDFNNLFIGTFFAVDNVSMAAFSMYTGKLIDKKNQKILLVFGIISASILFLLQAIVGNQVMLLLISFYMDFHSF